MAEKFTSNRNNRAVAEKSFILLTLINSEKLVYEFVEFCTT